MENPYRGVNKDNFNSVRDILLSGMESKSIHDIISKLTNYMSKDEARDLVDEEYKGMFNWQKN